MYFFGFRFGLGIKMGLEFWVCGVGLGLSIYPLKLIQTKFFTNQDGNTLLEKFRGIFQWCDVYHFDALIGFFYASGYFRLRPSLGKVSKIRILVGMEIDRLVQQHAQKGLQFIGSTEDARKEALKGFKKDIQDSEYSKEIEEGIYQLFQDVIEGKLEIRVHPSQEIHAKIYIFRQETEHEHPGYGSVITGSSNLSVNGLEKNFEFNVELRDFADIKYATQVFEKLWKESKELEAAFFEDLQKQTYLNTATTPFEVYVKFLQEHFGQSVDFDPELAGDMPDDFKILRYQIDAVKEGLHKLKLYNGFFLADVVGLGKTIMACLLARIFSFRNGQHTKVLVVTPPNLIANWKETMRKFDIKNVDVVSNAALHLVHFSKDYYNPEDYDLILIDEAHKYRNSTADGYEQIVKICKSERKHSGHFHEGNRKFVVLISATPLNNQPEDLRNLIYLFQDSKSNTLEINLQSFFAKALKEYKELKKKKIEEAIPGIRKLYENIRIKVLQPITLRRTRSDLLDKGEYENDLKSLGIHFPEILPPRKLLYQLDPELETLYDRTRILLTNRLTYARYQAIAFLLPPASDQFPQRKIISEALAKIMKTLLIKRLDSSFHSFKITLKAFHKANMAMGLMLKKGRIYIAPEMEVVENVTKGETAEEDFFEKIQELEIEEGKQLIFNSDDFISTYELKIEEDQKVLDELVEAWEKITQDPKLDMLVECMKNEFFNEDNREKKLVIFSEFKDTTRYITKALENRVPEYRYLAVDSQNRNAMRPTIMANFDANAKHPVDDLDVVVSTEVLAEGINLHRSNVVLNYDTPWNSTRLMQRIGRVNRIGSKADKVLVYNFFPTAQVEGDIKLKKMAIMKLQAFHQALGEDSTIYSPEDEETESFGMFEKPDVDEKDQRLELLKWLRKFKLDEPKEFNRIKHLPQRLRTGRNNRLLEGQSAVYLRTRLREAFSVVNKDGEITELSFVEMANLLEAKPGEVGLPLPEQHHEQVGVALHAFENEQIGTAAIHRISHHQHSPQDVQVIAAFEHLKYLPNIQPEEFELLVWAKEMIEVGRFEPMPRKLAQVRKKHLAGEKKKEFVPSEKALDEMLEVIRTFPKDQESSENTTLEEGEAIMLSASHKSSIIISESFRTKPILK